MFTFCSVLMYCSEGPLRILRLIRSVCCMKKKLVYVYIDNGRTGMSKVVKICRNTFQEYPQPVCAVSMATGLYVCVN